MHFLLAVEDNSLIESKATLDEFALAMKKISLGSQGES
jgi:hypothetical protein